MIWLFGIAGLCELIGLALAGVGFRQTWVTNGGQGSLSKAALVAFWNAMANGLRRIGIPIRKNATVVETTGTAESRSHAEGQASGMMPLPDPADNPAEFLDQLQARLAELHGKAYANEWAIKRESDVRLRVVGDLRAEMSSRTDQIEHLTKSVALDGLPLQAWGWLLVLIGVIIGTVGNVLQAQR